MSTRHLGSMAVCLTLTTFCLVCACRMSPDKRRGESEGRTYAWERFSELTRKDEPAWMNSQLWKNKCDLGLGPSACKNSDRRQQLLDDTPQLVEQRASQSAARTRFASVFYDATHASPFILHGQPCGNPGEKKADCSCSGALADKSILECYVKLQQNIDFPEGSVVLKTMWEVLRRLPRNKVQVSADKNNSNIRVVENRDHDLVADPVEAWTDPITVDWSNAKCQEREYQPTESIPLDCFFSQYFDGKDPQVNDIRTGAAGNAIWHNAVVSGEPFYLVLVGVHMAVKDRPDWTWMTFWWTRALNTPPQGKSANIRQRHFAWDVTQSDALTNGLPQACFNPYLELPQLNGARSNCLYCHRRAVFSPNPQKAAHVLLGEAALTAAQPGTSEVDLAGGIHTGFLWSVTDHQDNSMRTQFLQILGPNDTSITPNFETIFRANMCDELSECNSGKSPNPVTSRPH